MSAETHQICCSNRPEKLSHVFPSRDIPVKPTAFPASCCGHVPSSAWHKKTPLPPACQPDWLPVSGRYLPFFKNRCRNFVDGVLTEPDRKSVVQGRSLD